MEVAGDGVENQEVESQEGVEDAAPESNLDYEKGVKLSDKLNRDPEALDNSQISELEKLDKVRYNGKVISGKDLKNMVMLQSDYTKKTQAIAEERKYYENLPHDLKKLKANPALADEFRKVYPEKFHSYLDVLEAKAIEKQLQDSPREQPKEELGKSWKDDPEFKEILNTFQEQKLQTARVQVNTIFDKLQAKYPDADDSWVANKVQAEREAWKQQNPGHKPGDISESDVERHFKDAQAQFEKRAASWNARRFESQKKATEKARGPGSGGGIPGGAPRQFKTIKEATAAAMEDPSFN